MNIKNYFMNGWNWVHLFGSCVLTIALLKLTQWSPLIVFALGFLWECADECKKRYEWDLWVFDSNGFDIKDWLVMDLIGIVLALYLIGGIYAN